MMKKIIDPSKIIIHFKCCQCGAKLKIPLNKVMHIIFPCDKCNKIENFMKLVGVSIVESDKIITYIYG